ncbi:hypothetical protein TcCL_ESM10983 [Trypanosoma cruzi]|nr:hypothetical protein TcCL_ESM10983 [Trypanosoma cruzi]
MWRVFFVICVSSLVEPTCVRGLWRCWLAVPLHFSAFLDVLRNDGWRPACWCCWWNKCIGNRPLSLFRAGADELARGHRLQAVVPARVSSGSMHTQTLIARACTITVAFCGVLLWTSAIEECVKQTADCTRGK